MDEQTGLQEHQRTAPVPPPNPSPAPPNHPRQAWKLVRATGGKVEAAAEFGGLLTVCVCVRDTRSGARLLLTRGTEKDIPQTEV